MRSRIGLTCVFQSTLPLRGATSVEKILPGLKNISIHVPLAGSDATRVAVARFERHFNPRSPAGND